MTDLAYIGKSIPKEDARAKATGRAVYMDDLRFPGMLYGKVVRCWEHAHARVKYLDLSEAAKSPGVVKVLGPGDVTQKTYCCNLFDLMAPIPVSRDFFHDLEDESIFTDHVKHQGDAICGIIARTEADAERASKRIKVEYQPLPLYHNAEEASKPDALQFHPDKPNNLAFQLPEQMFPNNAYGWGDVDEAMKDADLIVEDTFYVSKQKQAQMEPHGYIGLYDDAGRLNCWTTSQMPKCVHMKIAKLFELPMTQVKIMQTTIGGAFGGRLGMIGEPYACAMAMAVPGHHIKVLYTREEDWVASESRLPGDYWMKIGFKKDGTPVAVDARFKGDGGGYYTHANGVPFTTGAWLVGMYKWGTCRYRGERYFTNHVPCGAYRGYGNPQTNFVMEQLVDRACRQLGIDPVEWRTKWHKDVGDDGWVLGFQYASCALNTCLKKGAEAIGWKEKREKYAHQTGVKRRGVGVAVMTHTSGAMPMLLEHTLVVARLNEDATLEIMVGCSDLGTGAHSVLRTMAAETLGWPREDVHLLTGDSDANGFDIAAHASRTIYVGGGAVISVCKDVIRQLKERAAKLLEVESPEQITMEGKKLYVTDQPEKSVTANNIAYDGVYNFVDPATGNRMGIPGQIVGYSSYFPKHNSPPFSAVFVEVEVDTETGQVTLIDFVNAYDIGKAIHPGHVEGQLEGGAQQGLGHVLTEDMIYDEDCKILNASFTDYKMLGPSDLPPMKILLIEEGDPEGPYGAKSCGESGLVNPVGATANAIYHALGIQFTRGPITPERILKGIREKGLQ